MHGIAFDIESADADQLRTYGPGFVRLCGWMDIDQDGQPFGDPYESVRISTNPADLVAAIERAGFITAHNGSWFDLVAMAWHHGLDYEAAMRKMFDTLIVEKHLNPVAAKGAQPTGYYGLDATAARYGAAGKSHADFAGRVAIARRVKGDAYADKMLKNEAAKQARREAKGLPYKPPADQSVLKILADLYGGFDKIPPDDPDYVHYLRLDVVAQAALFRAQTDRLTLHTAESRRYIRREHYVSATLNQSVTITGLRTDVDLTMRRWAEGQARLDSSKQMLHERFGMPLDGKKPHTTNAGKAAFRAALLACNISEQALAANWPLNQDRSLSTAKPVLTGMIEVFERTRPEAAELCRTILAMNGERTVYGTVLDNLVGDRVHPYISPDQSSGRWSMKDPGLTVLGKRGGKAVERAMILPDSDDEVLVCFDADQVDARGIAGLSQCPEYMKLFAPGMDLHSEVAWRVWSDPSQHGPNCHNKAKPDCCGTAVKCHCERRDHAKVFGHGWNYGMGPNGMARQHGVYLEVAQRFVAGMEEAFPRLAEWKHETRMAAGMLGYDEVAPEGDSYRVLYTGFGRPVRVERARAYTQACAQVGQGTTRDIMAEAILRLPADLRRRVRAVIHDELVMSLPREGVEERSVRIAESLGFDFHGVAITFGYSRAGRNWAGSYGEQYEAAA